MNSNRIPEWVLSEINCLIADRARLHNWLFGFTPLPVFGPPKEITQADVDATMDDICKGLGVEYKRGHAEVPK